MLWTPKQQFQPWPFEKEAEIENAVIQIQADLFGTSRLYLDVKRLIGQPGRTLVWPVLGTEIEICPAEGQPVRATRIEELIRSGYIATDGTETEIRVHTTPGAKTVVSITGT